MKKEIQQLIPCSGIDTLENFINEVRETNKNWFKQDDPVTIPWFRGQRFNSPKYKLIPSVLRNTPDGNSYDEFWMNTLFRNRAPALGNTIDRNSLDKWLLYMRHYKLPTRLLDWNESPLFALYFALKTFKREQLNNKEKYSPEYLEACPTIWAIEPLALNDFSIQSHSFPNTWSNTSIGFQYFNLAFQQLDKDENMRCHIQSIKNSFRNNEILDYPIAVQPSYSDYRMMAQRSVITIHGLKNNDFESLFTNTKLVSDGYFKKIIVVDNHENILNDLKKLGINESVVYPDSEGFAVALADWLVKKK